MRPLLAILFLKVCVFNLCSCDMRLDQPRVVYLFNTDDERHDKLNKLFIATVKKSTLNFVFRYIKVDGSLISTLRRIRPVLKNSLYTFIAIHLYVKDFYQENYNDILELDFLYAGDVGVEKELQVCQSVTTNKTKNNDTSVLETCQDSIEKQKNVKLISKSVVNYPRLHEWIIKINEHDIGKPVDIKQQLTIGVCGNDIDENLVAAYSLIKLRVDVKNENDCVNLNTAGMIAVLTPKPFEPLEIFVTTTIFYDKQDVTLPETKDMFPNSFPSVESTENLKFAFLKFIQERNWNRVGIISDDLETSKQFERELVRLFEKANIIYASQSCDVLNCKFTEVFKPFVAAEARIMIANIGEENIARFLEEMANKETHQMGLVWLFKTRSYEVAKALTHWKIGEVFSITLGPTIPPTDLKRLCNSKPCNILAPLNALEKFLHTNRRNINVEHLKEINYQRKLAETFKSYLYSEGYSKAYVKRYHFKNSLEWDLPIAEMTIPPTNIIKEYQEYHANLPFFRPELPDCTFKSDVYFKSCNDIEIMLIMLIVSVFSLTLLGIVFFFQLSDRSYSRMSC